MVGSVIPSSEGQVGTPNPRRPAHDDIQNQQVHSHIARCGSVLVASALKAYCSNEFYAELQSDKLQSFLSVVAAAQFGHPLL